MKILHDAISRHRAGQLAEAAALYRRILQGSPREPNALRLLGVIEFQSGNLDKAAQLLSQAIRANPRSPDSHYFIGRVCLEKKDSKAARRSFEAAVEIDPRHADALICLGNLALGERNSSAALDLFGRALGANPSASDAWIGQGQALVNLERHADALAAFDRALSVRGDLTAAWQGRANALRMLQRYPEALAACDKAHAIDPHSAETWNARGNILFLQAAYDDALSCYDQAIALNPGFAAAWNGRGNVLATVRTHGEALKTYDQAIACDPELADAWTGRGNSLAEIGRLDEAFSAFHRRLAIGGNSPEAWVGLGNILVLRKRGQEALIAYDNALANIPTLAEAWSGRGNALGELKRYAEAVQAYDRALELAPGLKFVRGQRLHFKMNLCEWRQFHGELDDLLTRVDAGEPVANPFCLLAVPASPDQQRKSAELYVAATAALNAPTIPTVTRHKGRPLRIAYVSADFAEHAVSYLIAGVFEHHDHARFETIGISLTPEQPSGTRQRIRNAMDHFIVVDDRSDEDVASLMRELDVDIAIDIGGLTGAARTGIFACRGAPVQVNYLGYPASMGAPFIDYIIADQFVVPRERRAEYAEKVVHLPDAYLPNDSKRKIASVTPSRPEAGLPDDAFVFCAFNASHKITPDIFSVWMRLLGEIEASVLWLSSTSPDAVANLRREAAERGVDGDRLIFAPRVPSNEDHLARVRLADLFIDTLYYNAHTTAADALWAGVPVLTCAGATFASRVAGSLLHAVGLPELVTHSVPDYEGLALALARSPARLASLREKLAHNHAVCPLFDTARFTRHLEAAYTGMWERWARGLAPESFAVEPLS